jgi:RNA-directed DNA polymerase
VARSSGGRKVDARDRKKRTTVNRDARQGIPQGSPISPLFSNVYMRRFVLGWKQTGLEHRLGARIVSYAGDLVIFCIRNNAPKALDAMRRMMSLLKLTVNEDKTRICRIPAEEFDFLGYTFGRRYSTRIWTAVHRGPSIEEECPANYGGNPYPDSP